MEKVVDADYPETQYDSPKSSKAWSKPHSSISKNNQPKNKRKEFAEVSRTRKEIAGENRSEGRSSEPGKYVANCRGREKPVRKEGKRVKKLNVLKGRVISARHGVQNTKTLQRNVPDRIGKYINSSVRPENNLLYTDCDSIAESSRNRSPESDAKSDRDRCTLIDCSETKSNMIGNECLSNKESVSLGDSIESDSGTRNIFEKIFDDCLGSTSIDKEASSQEMLNLETDVKSASGNGETVEKYSRFLDNVEKLKRGDARMINNEKTPLKRVRMGNQPNAPAKGKGHDGYYGSKKIRHVCGYCHKIFKSNGKLNSHVYSHTGERPFDCSNCGKAFSSKFKLVRHLLIHSEIRKFVCQICDRTFLRNDHLKNHYKIHDPQKKMYKCPKEHCDKEYSSVMSHKKHMAYHSVEDGDLKCLICNVKFETKEDVLFHLKSHSGSRLFKSQSDKKFKCDFCDRLFLTRKDVTRHLVVHTGERDFLCQFCPQRFGRKDHLVRHIKKSHVSEGMTVKNEIKQLIERKEEKRGSGGGPASTIPGPSVRAEPAASEADKDDETVSVDSEDGAGGKNSADATGKAHIVITVKNPMQKRKSRTSDSRDLSLRKSVPCKRKAPSSKNKGSTTQIFLQNIPNILIIPNNSIILLRNQSGSGSKIKKASEGNDEVNGSDNNDGNSPSADGSGADGALTTSAAHAEDSRFQIGDAFLPEPRQVPGSSITEDPGAALLQSDCSFHSNFNYNSGMFQQPPIGYPFSDSLSSFQSEMMTFGQQLESLNLEMLNHGDYMKRAEANVSNHEDGFFPGAGQQDSSKTGDGNPHTCDIHRKVGIVKPMTKTPDMEKEDLFEEVPENLMMTDSILNDFKVDDSVILPLENDGGILNNIFNQTALDGTGNELLRNLLMGENPMLSPLPGFSQIFQNSNTNFAE